MNPQNTPHTGAPAATPPKHTIIALKRPPAQTSAVPAPVPAPDTGTVATYMPPPPKPQVATRPQRKRRIALWASFVLAVLLPGALAIWYWTTIAEDRFLTTAGFVVRAVDEQSSPDMMGGMTGLMGATSTTSDTAIVLSFLESRDLVERVNRDIDLAAAWSGGEDRLHRFSGGSVEDLIGYWNNRVVPTHDTTTGLVTYEVQAFDSASALAISQSILTHAGDLVNRLSERARADALRASEAEVARAEERLRTAAEAQRAFRDEAGALNPLGSAEASVALIAQVEAQLSENQRRQAQLQGRVTAGSPQLIQLQAEEAGLVGQIATLRQQSGGDASLIARFESLELDKQFAQQAYSSALGALEGARVRAENGQRYLAVFQEPQMAERAVLPNRTLNALLSILGLFAIWSIGTLLVYHIRDKLV